MYDDGFADYVSGRQLFYDWENEEPIQLTIECLGPRAAVLVPKRARIPTYA